MWSGPRAIAAYGRRYGLAGTALTLDESETYAVYIDERTEGVELAETKAVGRQAVATELRELGRPTDEKGVRLVAAFKEVTRQLDAARTLAEIEQIDAVFEGLTERALRRASEIAGRRAKGPSSSRALPSPRRAVGPDRLAMLLQLRQAGHKSAPTKVLSGLGLLIEDPLPAGKAARGRRFRGAVPESTRAVVWDADGSLDPTVSAILDMAIAAERAQRPVVGTSVMKALGRA